MRDGNTNRAKDRLNKQTIRQKRGEVAVIKWKNKDASDIETNWQT
jgi:hypothetical protein